MLLVVAALAALGRAWPSLYTDCSTFPELGQPQTRFKQHPPMALLCEPTPDSTATFAWCAQHCSVQNGGKQNCSEALCVCKERCMGTFDVCQGQGAPVNPTHGSLPQELAAHAGHAVLLLDGGAPRAYRAGQTYRLSVGPGPGALKDKAKRPTWFLVDASGVGTFTAGPGGAQLSREMDDFRAQCGGSRAAFSVADNATVDVLWTVPAGAKGAVALRVATATAMGNLSITAAVLNSSTAEPSAPGYFCTLSQGSPHTPFPQRQCQRLPDGTPGALSMSACEAECFDPANIPSNPNGTRGYRYGCTRCAHVYDAERDGNGTAFEDLPDDWACPICGALKSAYAVQFTEDGARQWAHDD